MAERRRGVVHPEFGEGDPPRVDPRLFGDLDRSVLRWTLLSLTVAFAAVALIPWRSRAAQAASPLAVAGSPLAFAGAALLCACLAARSACRALCDDRRRAAVRRLVLATCALVAALGANVWFEVRFAQRADAVAPLFIVHALYVCGSLVLAGWALARSAAGAYWSLYHPAARHLAGCCAFLLGTWLVAVALGVLGP